jgi:hypothetical protein
MPGGFLSLSADGANDGIIWASFPQHDNTFFTQPGRLVAFDAMTLKKIWSDDSKKVGFAKFCPLPSAEVKSSGLGLSGGNFSSSLILPPVETRGNCLSTVFVRREPGE